MAGQPASVGENSGSTTFADAAHGTASRRRPFDRTTLASPSR